MAVTLKTPQDIQAMREAGKLAAEVLAMLKEHVKPGVTRKTWTAWPTSTS